MSAYEVGAESALQALGLIKTARFVGKDFMAGVDPTGTFTTSYGVEDTDEGGLGAAARGATGVAGGLLGGGLLVPSTIYGLINAPAGYAQGKLPGAAKGFWRGFKYPVQSVYRGIKGSRALSRAPKEGLTPEEVKLFKSMSEESNLPYYQQLLEGRMPSKAKGVVGEMAEAEKQRLLAEGMTAQEYKALPPEMREGAKEHLQSELGLGASQIGMAGAVGGGSAGLQYAKGREMGSFMTPEKRQEFVER